MSTQDNMTLQATVDNDGAKTLGLDSHTWSETFGWIARVLILIAVVIAPWLLGSVRFGAQFWISTILLIAMALWWFETALTKRDTQVLPYIIIFPMIGLLIGLIQTVPMSGGLADFFMGRQVELYQEFAQPNIDAESINVPARITLNRPGTWHQIRLLVIAISAMLLSCRYFRSPRDLTLFFTVMAVNGAAIAIFGAIQKFTCDPGKIFWVMELTQGGSPFGPFVNRNNCGGFLLMCLACAVGLMYMTMSVKKNPGPSPIISREIPFWRQFSQQILYFISELTAAKLAAMLTAVFISFGILASLSRGAVLALLFAVMFTFISYGVAKKPKNVGLMILPVSLAAILLTVWLGFNNELISRFDKLDSTTEVQKWDDRVQTWTDTWNSVGEMGKFGSGLGAYETVSRLYRSDKEDTVFSHAENNYFQSLVDAGWIGFTAYIFAWLFAFYYAYFLLRVGRSPVTVSSGLAGVFLLWGQAFASFLDFGLYIPANVIGMSCIIGVVGYYAHSMAYRLKQKSFLRFQLPNTFVQGVLVVVFASLTMVGMDLNRKSRVNSLKPPAKLTFENLSHGEVDHRIAELQRLAASTKSVDAMNQLGILGIHRTRLEMFELFKSRVSISDTDTESLKRIWDQTSLIRLQQESELRGQSSKLSQKLLRELETFQENLPFAKHWFEESLRVSPLQPEVQLTIGEIVSLLYGIDQARPYIERALRIAPSNTILLRNATVLYMQAGRFNDAAAHMKRYLELVPDEFNLMMRVNADQMLIFNQKVDQDLILNEMLPENAEILYQFASGYAEADSLTQKTALERAEDLLDTVSQSDLSVTILRGRIKLAMGDYESAIDFLDKALRSNPNDQSVKRNLIEILVAQERYEDALEHARDLIRSNDQNRRYRQLFNSIKLKFDEQLKN